MVKFNDRRRKNNNTILFVLENNLQLLLSMYNTLSLKYKYNYLQV
jgi:hypothetical protein